ncbi:hypothetical protein, partial [Geobacillus subterraneus]|uniref:hypothetical protein n=2 Tax=Geobacillus TaxID=129337 RepID=UPI00155DFD9B
GDSPFEWQVALSFYRRSASKGYFYACSSLSSTMGYIYINASLSSLVICMKLYERTDVLNTSYISEMVNKKFGAKKTPLLNKLLIDIKITSKKQGNRPAFVGLTILPPQFLGEVILK